MALARMRRWNGLQKSQCKRHCAGIQDGAEFQPADGTERGKEFLLRTPMQRFGKTSELVRRSRFVGVGCLKLYTDKPSRSTEDSCLGVNH